MYTLQSAFGNNVLFNPHTNYVSRESRAYWPHHNREGIQGSTEVHSAAKVVQESSPARSNWTHGTAWARGKVSCNKSIGLNLCCVGDVIRWQCLATGRLWSRQENKIYAQGEGWPRGLCRMTAEFNKARRIDFGLQKSFIKKILYSKVLFIAYITLIEPFNTDLLSTLILFILTQWKLKCRPERTKT